MARCVTQNNENSAILPLALGVLSAFSQEQPQIPHFVRDDRAFLG